jgi:hypothetical protein
LISVSENPAISGGLMIRESSDPESPFIACALSGKDKGYVRVKDERGGEVRESYFGGHVSEMIEIVKTNDLVSISTSGLGDDYDRHVIKFQSTGHTMIIGFFISSVDNSADATARFSHVRFFKASPSAY